MKRNRTAMGLYGSTPKMRKTSFEKKKKLHEFLSERDEEGFYD